MQLLMDHSWPGNVRELENTIRRATVLSQGGLISADLIVFSSAMERHLLDISQRCATAVVERADARDRTGES
jgi:DNA-binding NtrC family response regulator